MCFAACHLGVCALLYPLVQPAGVRAHHQLYCSVLCFVRPDDLKCYMLTASIQSFHNTLNGVLIGRASQVNLRECLARIETQLFNGG